MADEGAVALALVSRLIARMTQDGVLLPDALGGILRDTMLELQNKGLFDARGALRQLTLELEQRVPHDADGDAGSGDEAG